MDINPTLNQNPQSEPIQPTETNSGFAPDPLEFNKQTANINTTSETPSSSIYPEPTPELPYEPITVPSISSSPTGSPEPTLSQPSSTDVAPIAVVRVLSPRGVEYVFMTIALYFSAIGLGATIISLLNGATSFSVLAYPTAILIVSVPIFAFFFLRLKKSELYNPNLKLDPSKRRSTQFIQISSFVITFLTLIGLVSGIFAKMSGSYSGSIVKLILDALVILIISGGILFYYWHDEHKR